MNPVKIVLREMFYRKGSSLLILLTVIIAGTVSVGIYSLSKASENETRKIMREQGLNLFIFPKGTDLLDLYSAGETPVFPETYIDTLALSRTFDAVRHLTGILQVRYPDWKDPNGSIHRILLTGYRDEAMQRFLPKQEIMGTDVKKGTVHLGALVSKNIPEGMQFVIKGHDGNEYRFEIARRFDEGKGMADQGVALNLSDLQALLGLEGKINKIEALGCVCADGRINNARKQVQAVFPDLEVTELGSIADARENQRLMMNKYGAFIIPFVIVASLLITGFLFQQNVSARRYEIGLLKAMGTSNMVIIMMILVKAFILGLAGGIIGFFLGSVVAEYSGREIFLFTSQDIKPVWELFIYTVIIFPVLWILASWIPALLAARLDAARTLSEE